MPLISVPAIYDGEHVSLLENPPVHGAYSVMVTFVEPVKHTEQTPNRSRFWASFGAWHDDRAAEAILDDIHNTRRSKLEPPSL
jgi:hypothetical protein